MTDDIPEQPVAGRLEYPGIELGSATIDLDTGEIVEPVGAAAADFADAPTAPKTAFDSSAWLGELEAALRDAAEARKRAEIPWSEQAYNEAWADEQAIARVIRIMRGRCPTREHSNTPKGDA
jgi:hypothetical protein